MIMGAWGDMDAGGWAPGRLWEHGGLWVQSLWNRCITIIRKKLKLFRVMSVLN